MIHLNNHVQRQLVFEWMIQSNTPWDPSAPPALTFNEMLLQMLGYEITEFESTVIVVYGEMIEPAISLRNQQILDRRSTPYSSVISTGEWLDCTQEIPSGATLISGWNPNNYYPTMFYDGSTWLQAWDWQSITFVQRTGPWYKSSIRYYYFYQFNVTEYLFKIYEYQRQILGILPIIFPLALLGSLFCIKDPMTRPLRRQ
jgi:hypothetical protein